VRKSSKKQTEEKRAGWDLKKKTAREKSKREEKNKGNVAWEKALAENGKQPSKN